MSDKSCLSPAATAAHAAGGHGHREELVLSSCICFLVTISNYKLPQMHWLKGTQTYFVIIPEGRSPRWVSPGYHQGVGRATGLLEPPGRTHCWALSSLRRPPTCLGSRPALPFLNLAASSQVLLPLPSILFPPLKPSFIFKDPWDYIGSTWKN